MQTESTHLPDTDADGSHTPASPEISQPVSAVPPAPPARTTTQMLWARLPYLLLVLIVLAALALRLTGVNWDADSRLHPDERFLTGIVAAIGRPENLTEEARNNCPDQAQIYEYFNTACSVFNPNNINVGSYAYGTLPLYMVRGAALLVAQVNPGGLENPQSWTTYEYIHLVGRTVDAIADTIVVLLLFFIGLRLFNVWHGVVAAALYAFAVLPIQLAHFWVVDSITNMFFTVGLFAAVVVSKSGRSWAYFVFGVALGCAVASRVNIAPMAALLPLAVLVRLQNEGRLFQWRGWFFSEVLLVLGSLVLGVFIFRIAQPYAFAGPTLINWSINERWQREITEVSDMSRLPSDGWPPAVQWFERVRYAYPWFEMMMWGMGLFAGIVATIALFAALVSQVVRRRLSRGLALLSLWVIGYFAITGNVHQMTMRYYLPIYGALLLLAAWIVLKASTSARSWGWRLVLPVLLVGITIISGVSFTTTVYTQPITRVEASAWMNSNLPTTIDFTSIDGARVPMAVERTTSDLVMQTGFNGESYISDSFDLPADQPIRLEIQFGDPRETRLHLMFLDANNEQNQVTLKEWDLVTDEQGRAFIPPDDMPAIEAGRRYAWHILGEWSEWERTDYPGLQPPVNMRYFFPIMVVGEGDGESLRPVYFRSPYQSVNYIYLSPTQTVNLRSRQALTVTEVTFAHIAHDVNPIILSVNDEEYVGTPIEGGETDGIAWNNILGVRQRYHLDRPLEVQPDQPINVRADGTLLFTATGLALDGDWEDSVPTNFCDYSQTFIGGIGLARDCIASHSWSDYYFSELRMNMAETDTEVKYRRMVDVLTKADYLVISSNRFYDAQPRVLRRFAMSSEYYNRLFAGELNYQLLETFRRGSNFLGITFPHEVLPTDNLPRWMNELEAEEAFTVYDHPTVFVFQNAGFERFQFPTYTPPTTTPDGTIIQSEDTLAPLPAPTAELATRPQSDDDVVFGLIVWTFAFILLGWVAFPLMYALFPALPLGGFAIGRGLSWLLLAFVPWWLTAMLGRFFWTRPGIWVLVGLFVALNLFIAYRRRDELRAYLKVHWRSILVCELLFLAAFGVGLLVRAVNPDLWQIARGGEKPMDFAYLNAVIMTPVFPPPNPWMAGQAINYYYFGFVVIALPIKLIGVASEVGYNLGLASLYASVFMVVFTLGYALVPQGRKLVRFGVAVAGTLFAMLAGNLGTLRLILFPDPGMEPNSHRWYWYPTRVLGESANGAGGAINEFPIFSFLFGDLHAHIIGLLPTMLLLTGMWTLHKQKRWWIAVLVGVIAGTIYMTNIWDVLLYAPIGALLLWAATRDIKRFILYGILIGLGAGFAVIPYLPHLALGDRPGIELWNFERSLIDPFLLAWGIPVGIAAIWMFKRAGVVSSWLRSRGVKLSLFIIVAVLIIALPPILATTVLCAVLALGAFVLAWRDTADVRLVHLGFGMVFLILLGLEYVVVIGDVARMNTVFKISFQMWMWVGLLIPLVLYWLLRNRWFIASAATVVLIGFGLLFAVYAVPARLSESLAGSLTLDGDRFFPVLDQQLGLQPGSVIADLDLIRYLRAHSSTYPVIAEWYETEYTWNGRFSVQTGLPAIVGWGNHMRQQYGARFAPEVDVRIDDMRSIYLSNDINRIRDVIRRYDVRYILVGSLERVRMTPGTLDRFDELIASGEMERVYTVGESAVYEVKAQ